MPARVGITRAEIKDAVNRMNPAAAQAMLGDVLSDLLDGHNAHLVARDAESAAVMCATVTLTVGGTIATNDTMSVTFTNAGVTGLPVTVGPVTAGSTVAATVAATIAAAINANAVLRARDISAVAVGAVITLGGAGAIHNATVVSRAVVGGITGTLANSGAMAGGLGVVVKGRRAAYGVTPPEDR
ncbi:hypothetical protein UFOVP326_22 [uncultured Caudovirales phage]|uniref:Uncharacterized protein n=1 Tax=uncultured Caudovirales phage TaxID=2100421 RepID=A0A6J5LWL3_9CAUD|nr:hypothetical protein UFOVP326_22 [uncultured Caudovirales phage]